MGVKKCDVCGKIYEENTVRFKSDDEDTSIIGIIFVKSNRHSSTLYDCCDDCLDDILCKLGDSDLYSYPKNENEKHTCSDCENYHACVQPHLSYCIISGDFRKPDADICEDFEMFL